MKNNHKKLRLDSQSTICRILIAATELFAAKGFHKTSVREIASHAECNIALVNYHFHGKEQLYKVVFKNQIKQVIHLMNFMSHQEDNDNSHILENDLMAVITSLMSVCTDRNPSTLFIDLFYQEMTDPHLPREYFMQEMVSPIKNYLHALFCRNLPNLCSDSADLCTFSFASQLLGLINLNRFFNKPGHPQSVSIDTDRVIRHMIEFSAAGAVHLSIKDQCQLLINSIDEI